MKYQLVIQFPEELYGDIDWIAELEDQIDESILDGEVDGHDIGSGEVNIFVHCNEPINTFNNIKNILEDGDIDLSIIKAAYRENLQDHYIPLWPANLKDFKIL